MIPADKIKENLKVLLVEDNLLNQKLMSINLSKLHCIVSIANNGLEGVELFKKQTFDVILMELMMPVMDGFEASREIRRIERKRKSHLLLLLLLLLQIPSTMISKNVWKMEWITLWKSHLMHINLLKYWTLLINNSCY